MGRGTIRAASATTTAARNRWFDQQMNRAKRKAAKGEGFDSFDGQQLRISAESYRYPVPSYRRWRINHLTRMGAADTAKQFGRIEGGLRLRALREAQRRGLNATNAQSYVRSRVAELRKQTFKKFGGNTRQEWARRTREARVALGRAPNRSEAPSSRAEFDDYGTRARQNSPDRSVKNARARERERGRQRRRAAGMQARSLRTLRRVQPGAVQPRPARRRYSKTNPSVSLKDRVATSLQIARSRLFAEARRFGQLRKPENYFRWHQAPPRRRGGRPLR